MNMFKLMCTNTDTLFNSEVYVYIFYSDIEWKYLNIKKQHQCPFEVTCKSQFKHCKDQKKLLCFYTLFFIE